MAQGHLNPEYVPIVPVEFAGTAFEAVVDTGFECGLQLPATLYPLLNPTPFREVEFEVGGGGRAKVITFWIAYTLDGLEYTTEGFFAASDQVLLGLDVLKSCRLEINFVTGSVVLERVASP